MSLNASAERPLIAWVDDDADYRALAGGWLEQDYDVRGYGEGGTFLAQVDRLKPDAIILDLALPGADGFSICRELRRRGIGAPVLFLTSSVEEDDFVRHLELGATGYLTKPVGRRRLLARLAELVDGARAPKAAAGGPR